MNSFVFALGFFRFARRALAALNWVAAFGYVFVKRLLFVCNANPGRILRSVGVAISNAVAAGCKVIYALVEFWALWSTHGCVRAPVCRPVGSGQVFRLPVRFARRHTVPSQQFAVLPNPSIKRTARLRLAAAYFKR